MPEEEEETLQDFQDALIELLSSGQPELVIFETLKTDPRFENYRDYIAEFDPDMVAVACELMGKWAKWKEPEEI
ncbi:MAG TPA: hypothetical protein EYN91_27415 [Candidatus Melainabacteria bacterium]|jgi:hypothetical protein|nr:hypothetical protein [Candidatus Melainabacteria bacterium]HIN67195.1 hypothetical protein [Candidatus Obscuribacterales bacterium]